MRATSQPADPGLSFECVTGWSFVPSMGHERDPNEPWKNGTVHKFKFILAYAG